MHSRGEKESLLFCCHLYIRLKRIKIITGPSLIIILSLSGQPQVILCVVNVKSHPKRSPSNYLFEIPEKRVATKMIRDQGRWFISNLDVSTIRPKYVKVYDRSERAIASHQMEWCDGGFGAIMSGQLPA